MTCTRKGQSTRPGWADAYAACCEAGQQPGCPVPTQDCRLMAGKHYSSAWASNTRATHAGGETIPKGSPPASTVNWAITSETGNHLIRMMLGKEVPESSL